MTDGSRLVQDLFALKQRVKALELEITNLQSNLSALRMAYNGHAAKHGDLLVTIEGEKDGS